jgi:hypothetical protein
MKKLSLLLVSVLILIVLSPAVYAKKPKYKVLALADNGGGHVLFSKAGKVWLNKLAEEKNFTIDYISSPNVITKDMLNQYRLFIHGKEKHRKLWKNIWSKVKVPGLDSTILPC